MWVAAEGRDKGKKFLITEMPADQAERWATRGLLALANAGTKLPDGALDAGMAGMASFAAIAVMSLRTLQGLEYAAVAPLLEEMMECVRVIPPGQPDSSTMPLLSGELSQIEEVKTRLQLKWEVLQVHVDFSLADALSTSKGPPDTSAPSA